MILIRFTETDAKRRALGYLAGRFPFKSWASGEMLVPESALPFLTSEGVSFFEDPPSRDQMVNSIPMEGAENGDR